MTAPTENMSVATRDLSASRAAHIDEIRARNQMVTAIRNTAWGKDCTPDVQRAVAEYARQNNLDPVRHIEILGGRIYLTAALFDEKGAALIRAGVIIPDEPDYINADARLDELAAKGDAWAVEESTRRIKLRIQYNVPEKSLAAVVQRFVVAQSGAVIVGVNWCGGNGRRDPVGDAEPAKTAQTRARRRAWTQIADIIPGYAEIIRPLEATARVVNESLPVATVAALASPTKAIAAAPEDDPYDVAAAEDGELGL